VLVRSRAVWWAVGAGFVAATASVVAVLAVADRAPAVDGDFVLDTPGEFAEPIDSIAVAGEQVPDLELVDEAGVAVTLADFRGVPTVVNVWYSTCAPCAREVLDFAVVHGELGDEVQFVGVNPIDDTEAMLAFAAARDVGYTLLRDPDRSWVSEVPVTVYPTTLFVDADGRIVHQTSAIDAAELRQLIAEVF